jgi:hypothetical protein
VVSVTRGTLFLLSGFLAIAGAFCLSLGASLGPDLRSFVGDNYRQYSGGEDAGRYECDGPPRLVADELAAQGEPEVRKSDRGTEYLRYEDDIVTVGPDGSRPCSVQVEGLEGGYSHGSFVFLGPGFSPGSPAGGSGGGPGGPDGTK